ncbi:hypothetical protein R6Q59_029508 [Mikania micrantha]
MPMKMMLIDLPGIASSVGIESIAPGNRLLLYKFNSGRRLSSSFSNAYCSDYIISLVESQKLKKKTLKSISTNGNDVNYVPDMGDDSESDHQQVATRSKKEKYDVPDAAKKWVLMTIGHSYKVHKCRFKKQHFYQFRDDKTRWKNRPKSIPEGDFAQLLRLWNNTNVKKRCLWPKEIRMSQKNMHTAGPKSFARIRDEMINDDPNKELPTLTKMFEHTRKRTEGRAYVDTYDDTERKIISSYFNDTICF